MKMIKPIKNKHLNFSGTLFKKEIGISCYIQFKTMDIINMNREGQWIFYYVVQSGSIWTENLINDKDSYATYLL